MKKIASMFMAVAMILALAVPALAGTSSGTITGSAVTSSALSGHKSDFLGEYQDTVLDIELPNNVVLVFNPYRLQYSASSHSSDIDLYLVDKLADQIFSAPVTIVSKSNIQLDVDMEFVVSKGTGSNIILAADVDTYESAVDPVNETPGQNVLLQLQYGLVNERNEAPSGAEMRTITLPETADLDEGKLTLATLQQTEDAKDDTDTTKQQLTVTIPAGDENNPHYFGYKFTGKAQTTTEAPGQPKDPYDDQDTINVNIAFTFVPAANPDNQIQAVDVYTYQHNNTTSAVGVSDIQVTLPDDFAVAAVDGSTVTRSTFDVTSPKYETVVGSAGSAVSGITLANDGKTLTIKKEMLFASRATATPAGKYVVVVPVDFVAKTSATGAQEEHKVFNVRVIMNPTAT